MAVSAPPAGLSRFFSIPEGSKADSPKPGQVNPVHEASAPGCPELSSGSLEKVLETPGVGELFQEHRVIALLLEEPGLLRACLCWKQKHRFVTSASRFYFLLM